MKKTILFTIVFLLFTLPALAADLKVTLGWDEHVDASVVGYRVYFGTESRNYDQQKGQGVDVPGKATTEYQVTNLTQGTMYFFAVTAYDNEGFESDYSNEVSTDGATGLIPIAPGVYIKKIEVNTQVIMEYAPGS